MAAIDHGALYTLLRPILLNRTGSHEAAGGRIWAFCPVHGDGSKHGHNPAPESGQSLSLHPKMGLTCFGCAGDTFWEILAALGVQREEVLGAKVEAKKVVKVYDYRAVDGTLLAQKARLEDQYGNKSFKWRLPREKNWTGLQGKFRPEDLVYGLELLVKQPEDAEVWFVEGEKCVDAIRTLGGFGLCLGSGAGSRDFTNTLKQLKGRHVILWPDKDEPTERYPDGQSQEYMREVSAALVAIGVLSVKVVDVSKLDLPLKGDAFDWLDKGRSLNEVIYIPHEQEGKRPPYDEGAERIVLGGLFDSSISLEILSLVANEDFYVREHAVVASVCQTLIDAGTPIDVLTVVDALERSGRIAQAGGKGFIDELAAIFPLPDVVRAAAQIVVRDAVFRRLARAGERIHELGAKMDGDPEVALARAEELLYGIRTVQRVDIVSVGDVLQRDWDNIVQFMDNPGIMAGIPTGFPKLDMMTGGLEGGRLYTIAGATSHGKSMFALNISRSIAEQGFPVLLFALEMSAEQVTRRMLFGQAGINRAAARRIGRPLDQQVQDKVLQEAGYLGSLPIYYMDQVAAQAETIIAVTRRMARQYDIKVMMVDHIDLVTLANYRDSNRHQELSAIIKRFKALARDLEIPVILMSQLSREIFKRKNPYPVLADLRESGSKEEDSDLVMFVYYPWGVDQREPENEWKLIIAKNRDGEQGTIRFIGDKGRQIIREA